MEITKTSENIYYNKREYIRTIDSQWLIYGDGEWYDITNDSETKQLERAYKEKDILKPNRNKINCRIEALEVEIKELTAKLEFPMMGHQGIELEIQIENLKGQLWALKNLKEGI